MAPETRPFSESALIDLLDAFASNTPVPGGGSAAALAGALGVSLLVMAASLPKSRTGAPEEAADLAAAAARLRPLRDRLVELIDADAAAYRSVMAAMKLPKGSAEEQARRTAALQTALKDATDAPLDVLRICQQALDGAVIVARNGYRAAAADVGMGIELLSATVRGTLVNINGNLGAIKDSSYVESVSTEQKALEIDSGLAAGLALDILAGLRSSLRP
jgi:formiminotetrahydrofolate cyclodeaminase